jgi:predicted DCC family thiol-disulfide oxidoreductase YuxK
VTNQGKVASAPVKPVMLFDEDCGFCRRWIARWQDFTGDTVEYIPYQDPSVAQRFPELVPERMAEAVHLVAATGDVFRGAEAVFRTLAIPRERHWTVWAYQRLPGFASVSEFFYGLVARHRMFFSWLTRLLWGAHVERPTYHQVRSIFIRGLGLIYLIAFVSLYNQAPGLIGDRGILPTRELIDAFRDTANYRQIGLQRYALFPTFGWISGTETFTRFQAGVGIALAVLVVIGVAPAPCLLLLWALYLSLSVLSRVFLNYQWDALLLETGFLAIFFAPLFWLRGLRGPRPSRTVLWLLRWLLFRLMFLSGAVKLLSGDPTWHDLTALHYHYETQPLPTWVAWHAHHLPAGFQKFSTQVMFFIELGLPFLIFFPRRIRFVAFVAFVLLQLGIALTGNYTFFNLLAILLCISLLDDAMVAKIIPKRWRATGKSSPPQRPAQAGTFRHAIGIVRRVGLAALAAFIVMMSSFLLYGTLRHSLNPDSWLAKIYRDIASFRSINSYGLFAVMTTNRPEIIIEGSNDGQAWRAYEFQYKPGALDRRPVFVAPHQPRVDWQMWFAALGTYQHNPWFMRFCQALLQGSPPVLELLEKNPFPDAPPKFIRATLYEYHFTTPQERAKTGNWWRREYKGPYCPVLSLK